MNKYEEAKISLDHQSIKLDEFGRFEMAEIVDPALLEEVSGGMRRELFYNIIGCSGRSWYWV